MRKKFGFTLAEVLITLAIIGIIAAMTVPNLMQNWRKQERISQLQVAYSILQNATKMAVAEHGDMSSWDFIQDEETDLNASLSHAKAYAEKYFIPYVKTKDKGAFRPELKDSHGYQIQFMNGKKDNVSLAGTTTYSVTLDNGMLIHIHVATSSVDFFVDVNGFQRPNMFANDLFVFRYDGTNNKVSPFPSTTNDCTQNYISGLSNTASESDFRGTSCAHNIITNGWKFPDDYPIKKF